MSKGRGWVKTGLEPWRRPLDTRERMVIRQVQTKTPGHFPGLVVMTVRLEHRFGDALADRLLEAWKAVRYFHPSVAAVVEGDSLVYREARRQVAERWLRRTFHVHHPCTGAAAVYARLRGAHECSVHVLPRTSEVMLEGPHWILDAVGTMLLLDEFCRFAASEPRFQLGDGTEPAALPPPLDAAAAIPAASDMAWQTARSLVADWTAKRSAAICIETTPRDGGGHPGPFRRMRTVLPAADTAAVQAFARSRGLSVTHITHAAAIVAAQRHSSGQAGRHWVGGLPVNARPWCHLPHVAGPYFVGVPSIVEAPQGLLDAAQKLKAQYNRWLGSRCTLQLLEPLEQIQRPPNAAADVAGPAMPVYSGLGIVERFIRPHRDGLRVRDFWVGLRNISPTMVGIYCYTFAGQLCFDVNFNPTYHGAASMERLQHLLVGVLREQIRAAESPN